MHVREYFAAVALVALIAIPAVSVAQVFTDDFNRADGPPGPDWTAVPFPIPTWNIVSNEACSDTGGLAVLATEHCGSSVRVEYDFHADGLNELETAAIVATPGFGTVVICQVDVDTGFGTAEIDVRNPFTMTDYGTSAPAAVSIANTYHMSAEFTAAGSAICTITLAGTPTVVTTVTAAIPALTYANEGFLVGGGSPADAEFGCADDFELYVTSPVGCPAATTTTTTTSTTSTTTTSTTSTTSTTLAEGGCPETPRTGCLTGAVGKSSLKIGHKGNPKDKLGWKLGAGPSLSPPNFGIPTTPGDTTYYLCIYDGAGTQPVQTLQVDSGANWKAAGDGFQYSNKDGNWSGVTKIKLKPGDVGKSQIQVQAKGTNYNGPLPITDPVTVQFFIDAATPLCLETEFATATKSDGEGYSAKGPGM